MSDALKFPAARQAATELDQNGNEVFTRPWFLFFQQLYARVGGPNGASTSDNEASALEDAGSSETQQMIFTARQDAAQQPPIALLLQAVDDLTAELSAQRDQIAELTKELDSIKQGQML